MLKGSGVQQLLDTTPNGNIVRLMNMAVIRMEVPVSSPISTRTGYSTPAPMKMQKKEDSGVPQLAAMITPRNGATVLTPDYLQGLRGHASSHSSTVERHIHFAPQMGIQEDCPGVLSRATMIRIPDGCIVGARKPCKWWDLGNNHMSHDLAEAKEISAWSFPGIRCMSP